MKSRKLTWSAGAAVALIAGYAALATGDITLAPVLLVAGYIVLIPIAILKS